MRYEHKQNQLYVRSILLVTTSSACSVYFVQIKYKWFSLFQCLELAKFKTIFYPVSQSFIVFFELEGTTYSTYTFTLITTTYTHSTCKKVDYNELLYIVLHIT